MSAVAVLAGRVLERPVVDRTGLTGRWNLRLTYADPLGVDADPNLPSFSAALQEQLGVKVESGVGLLDVLVVDSVQPPTEN
jgi:uncharacterized protein (TIGR03435 family)